MWVKIWNIGNVWTPKHSGKLIVILDKEWQKVSKGKTAAMSKAIEPITDEIYKKFLEKWNKPEMDNARKSIIVATFDKRKNKRKPPNIKSTSII